MTESNTPSDIGPNSPKPRSVMVHWKGESFKAIESRRETPRERMARVAKAVQKQRKKKNRAR